MAIAQIPDPTVRKQVEILKGIPEPTVYKAAISTLWNARFDPFANATLAMVYYKALHEDSLASSETRLIRKVSKRLDSIEREDIPIINRMRLVDGLSPISFEYFRKSFTVDLLKNPKKAAAFESLASYNGQEGKHSTYYAISILA